MMQIHDFKKMEITGDTAVMERATAAGVDISTVNIEGYRLDADVLSKLWLTADAHKGKGDVQAALTYAAVKAAIKAANE